MESTTDQVGVENEEKKNPFAAVRLEGRRAAAGEGSSALPEGSDWLRSSAGAWGRFGRFGIADVKNERGRGEGGDVSHRGAAAAVQRRERARSSR